ncbi:MAG: hotdog fold domain-containing protein [Woeseiaceae bacterium]
MSRKNFTLSMWQRLSTKPAGKWLFSRLVCWKAPYFSTIRPRFVALRPGYCEVHIRKRRRVLNHIGTVHAIAMCNMAEIAGGTMTDVTVPPGFRWIPKGMTVEYLAKAQTDLTATARIEALPDFDQAMELPVTVAVKDSAETLVFRAVITMWVSPKRT